MKKFWNGKYESDRAEKIRKRLTWTMTITLTPIMIFGLFQAAWLYIDPQGLYQQQQRGESVGRNQNDFGARSTYIATVTRKTPTPNTRRASTPTALPYCSIANFYHTDDMTKNGTLVDLQWCITNDSAWWNGLDLEWQGKLLKGARK